MSTDPQTTPTYEDLLQFVKDVRAYTNRKCVEQTDSIQPLRKAMLNINLSAIKLLGDMA